GSSNSDMPSMLTAIDEGAVDVAFQQADAFVDWVERRGIFRIRFPTALKPCGLNGGAATASDARAAELLPRCQRHLRHDAIHAGSP
ncbi:hypothetical protein, partial [Burkholderia sp. SIMBA_052]|uniref:hypothetical protein n=1 Tax=Burkholderia sp. SIMBA_052 TaxID=3085793 RepID=UPI00397DA614